MYELSLNLFKLNNFSESWISINELIDLLENNPGSVLPLYVRTLPVCFTIE